MFHEIYYTRDKRLYSPADLLLHAFEETAVIAESFRKESQAEIQPAIARFCAWIMAFCNDQHIDLQNAVFSKYHGICPYCGAYQHCSCISAETKPRKWRRDPSAKAPNTLAEWQRMFDRIYGRVNRVAGREKCWLHVHEELGEISQAFRLRQRNPLRHELADIFAWLMAFCNHLNLHLDDVILAEYPGRCDVCKRSKCKCPMV